jgi:hypothetical protein
MSNNPLNQQALSEANGDDWFVVLDLRESHDQYEALFGHLNSLGARQVMSNVWSYRTPPDADVDFREQAEKLWSFVTDAADKHRRQQRDKMLVFSYHKGQFIAGPSDELAAVGMAGTPAP